MKICVISIGDKVTLLILGLLTIFIIEGNAKFQLEVWEHNMQFFFSSKFMAPSILSMDRGDYTSKASMFRLLALNLQTQKDYCEGFPRITEKTINF